MPRVKGGTIHAARRKKVLNEAKGYFGSKHRLYRTAKEQVMHSLSYAYGDRRQKKRDFRKLWITRINAACRENEISYSRFIEGLNYAGVEINRKMASEIAINDPKAFTEMVNVAKEALKAKKEGKPVAVKKEAVNVKADTKTAKKATVKEEKDLSKMTVAELKELAASKNIAIPAGSKKADILNLLK